MTVKIPYFNSRLENDILFMFLLTPFWWVSGLSVFIFQAVSLALFLKFLMILLYSNQSIKIPKPASWFFLFLVFYILSILVNAGIRPPQRIFASINNYTFLVMGMILMLMIYQCDAEFFFENYCNVCRILCAVSGVLGLFFLANWLWGNREADTTAWLGSRMPALMESPFFYNLMHLKGTVDEESLGTVVPRLALYTSAPTSTGGFMLLIIPMMMAYYALHPKKKIEYGFVLFLSLTALVFSMTRAAIYGLVLGWVLVRILEGGKKQMAASLLLFALTFNYLSQATQWLWEMRKSSNAGRIEVVEDAIRIVSEQNIWMGVGIHMREGFVFRAIGTHALYVEILFVSGLLGLAAFILFQASLFYCWYAQKTRLEDPLEKILWRFLGMTLISVNVWIFTDSLTAVPYTPYGYFLMAGGIFLLDRALRTGGLKELSMN